MAECKKCGIALTEENWQASHKRRNVRRCRACHYKVVKAWTQAHPEAARKKSADWKKRNPNHYKDYYKRNVDEYSQRARLRLWKIKSAVFEKLDNKCCKCGIDDPRVLQINHINGGGTQEALHGADMYQAILAGQRPLDDLDLRCANCNIIYEYECGRRSLPQLKLS